MGGRIIIRTEDEAAGEPSSRFPLYGGAALDVDGAVEGVLAALGRRRRRRGRRRLLVFHEDHPHLHVPVVTGRLQAISK